MMPQINADEIAEGIASQLQEDNKSAIKQIKMIIEIAGEAFARTHLQKTLEIEEKGGMFVEEGDVSQRRSPGGVFFYLAKKELSDEQKKTIFPSLPRKKKPRPPIEVGPQAQLFAHQATSKLKDEDPQIKETIGKIAQLCGLELSQSVLDIITELEGQDGLRRADGNRRTAGEAFLYVASRRMTEDQRNRIWPVLPVELRPPKVKQPAAANIPKPKRSPTPDGMATTIKISLIGRPEKVERKPGYIVCYLSSLRIPSLPTGLPEPAGSTSYRIYVQDKQWDRVSSILNNPNDSFVIEGYPTMDKDNKIAIFTTSIKSSSIKKSNPFSYR